MSQQHPRVFVTGAGVLSPIGNRLEDFWTRLIAGESGAGPITRFDTSAYETKFACEIKDLSLDGILDRKEAKRMDRFVQFAVVASHEAVQNARLDLPNLDLDRAGVLIGSGIGGMETFETQHRALIEKGPGRVSPFFIPMMISDMAAGQVSIQFGLRGPNFCTVSACASGAHAIGESLVLIRDGRQDVMLAGGAEAPVCLLAVGGFSAMRALATGFNDEPERASRPFDARRDGFVIAEGAAVLVLEALDHARARGARVYAEVTGYGANCDAYHMTQPAPEGVGASECMTLALQDGGIAPTEVGYINAHGTGTQFNDVAETQAVKRVFGEHAAALAMSSTKSMTGHSLGASGTIEAAYTVLALVRGVLPPTINLEEADPECDLDYVREGARSVQVETALSNSFGFGGTNVTLGFRRYP